MAEETILVVDDDENVHEILSLYLEKEDFKLVSAYSGKEALDKTEQKKPDLIVLDIMMPELDGKEVIKKLRPKTEVPVIFLSAKSEEFDRILGLEIGADDYVTKPFSPREVVARIKTILKRVNSQTAPNKKEKLITYPKLQINPKERRVVVSGEEIDLSPKEYELLLLLAKHPRQVFSREKLYNRVWGRENFGQLRSVDVHINWLRDKLDLDYIQTVWGVGYRFEVEENDK